MRTQTPTSNTGSVYCHILKPSDQSAVHGCPSHPQRPENQRFQNHEPTCNRLERSEVGMRSNRAPPFNRLTPPVPGHRNHGDGGPDESVSSKSIDQNTHRALPRACPSHQTLTTGDRCGLPGDRAAVTAAATSVGQRHLRSHSVVVATATRAGAQGGEWRDLLSKRAQPATVCFAYTHTEH